jgi:Na+(H+)/acetate symporter ActP
MSDGMDKEILSRLDQLAAAAKEIGGAAWEAAVRYQFWSGVADLIGWVVGAALLALMIRTALRIEWANLPTENRTGYQFTRDSARSLTRLLSLIVGLIFVLVSCLGALPGIALRIASPEGAALMSLLR